MSVNTATEMSSKKSNEETTEDLVVAFSSSARTATATCKNLVLELKNNASKLLLAVMESRILYNMNPRQLVDVACRAYHQKAIQVEEDDGPASPKEVGHNIYILCHQLAQHNKDLGGRHV